MTNKFEQAAKRAIVLENRKEVRKEHDKIEKIRKLCNQLARRKGIKNFAANNFAFWNRFCIEFNYDYDAIEKFITEILAKPLTSSIS